MPEHTAILVITVAERFPSFILTGLSETTGT
jgi:hypothetical protein